MPVFRDQRMLRRDLLPKEPWNMILMPGVTITAIITAAIVAMSIVRNINAQGIKEEAFGIGFAKVYHVKNTPCIKPKVYVRGLKTDRINLGIIPELLDNLNFHDTIGNGSHIRPWR